MNYWLKMLECPEVAPAEWGEPCVHSECTLHQLSPYIGKLKSAIARPLIQEYSRKGEIVVDPFSGAGTIPLEAILLSRKTFGADISPYAEVLTRAKLWAPPSEQAAIREANRLLHAASKQPAPDLRKVPRWVKSFFHPQTLKEIIALSNVCKERRKYFTFACLLGILHHQRPGFLSYPSSHLVPYLRDRKFPPKRFPELYEYREIRSRLLAKIGRAYKRPGYINGVSRDFRRSSVQGLSFPDSVDCVITSPPYMNALDYGRDNRLRLWLINPTISDAIDRHVPWNVNQFKHTMKCVAHKIDRGLREKGYAVFVVGEHVNRRFQAKPSEVLCAALDETAPRLKLVGVYVDRIPDVRRTRGDGSGTKPEHVLVFRKS